MVSGGKQSAACSVLVVFFIKPKPSKLFSNFTCALYLQMDSFPRLISVGMLGSQLGFDFYTWYEICVKAWQVLI